MRKHFTHNKNNYYLIFNNQIRVSCESVNFISNNFIFQNQKSRSNMSILFNMENQITYVTMKA